jgi:hypothetical protein
LKLTVTVLLFSFLKSSKSLIRSNLFVASLLFGIVIIQFAMPSPAAAQRPLCSGDRIWLLDVRSLPTDTCNVCFPVRPNVKRVSGSGQVSPSSYDEYLQSIAEGRPTVIYVHGNRMPEEGVVERGLFIFNHCVTCKDQPVDWAIWSWPSEREGLLGYDIRTKADRTDAQGLMLADVLRQHAAIASETTLIGFSFGGRIVTGALHALAGGQLDGRLAPGDPIKGANFRAGLVAPAIGDRWLAAGSQHELATQNLEKISVLFNQRDAILKRYWLIDRVRGQMALGFTGPKHFAPRFDGSVLPVAGRDCSHFVGLSHVETEYYEAPCMAGREISKLIGFH